MDETYLGPRRVRGPRGRGARGKTAIVVAVEQRLKAPGVLASRNAAGHGVDGVIIERISIGNESEARQLHLLTVLGPNPQPADGNTADAQGDTSL